ncbi:MAG TPA: GLPGLI family protein [Lentimicrobium sp.]|nr:GLPGLI family protein [Lentimicrobium sp.]
MKILFTTVIATSFAFLSTSAQESKSGSVEYTEKVKLEIHFQGDADMLPRLPDEDISKRILYFTPDASLYVSSQETEETGQIEEMEGGGRMVVKVDKPESKVYMDIKNANITEQREFLSRTFLIQSPVETHPWKLTGNRKEILGYPCIEASYTKDTTVTIAWFTPSIPVETGPARYSGLPGLILEVIADQGKRIITATSVKLGDVAGMIAKPNKGRKMTKEEFNKMVDEKRAEQGQEGGEHVVIRIKNN